MTAPDQKRKALRSAETRLAYAITHNAFAVLSPDECRAIADALAAALTPAPSPEPKGCPTPGACSCPGFAAPPGPREPSEDAKCPEPVDGEGTCTLCGGDPLDGLCTRRPTKAARAAIEAWAKSK